MKEMNLFNADLSFWSGMIGHQHRKIVRTLRDMADQFQDAQAVRFWLESENPVIYEFHEYVVGHSRDDLIVATSTLYPGKIGKEFYMTRGHFHKPLNCVEVYFVYKGKGMLLMQSGEGRFLTTEMLPGSIIYVPPEFFHRTVNIGNEPLVFFGIYSGGTEHDYGSENLIKWVSKIVIEINDEARLVDNPKRNVEIRQETIAAQSS